MKFKKGDKVNVPKIRTLNQSIGIEYTYDKLLRQEPNPFKLPYWTIKKFSFDGCNFNEMEFNWFLCDLTLYIDEPEESNMEEWNDEI